MATDIRVIVPTALPAPSVPAIPIVVTPDVASLSINEGTPTLIGEGGVYDGWFTDGVRIIDGATYGEDIGLDPWDGPEATPTPYATVLVSPNYAGTDLSEFRMWNTDGSGGGDTGALVEARNTRGNSPRGFRLRVGNGKNGDASSGGEGGNADRLITRFVDDNDDWLKVQTFWMRAYIRFESGFTWEDGTSGSPGDPSYIKIFDFFEDSGVGNSSFRMINGIVSNKIGTTISHYIPLDKDVRSSTSWNDVFGSGTAVGDGKFHMWEFYFSMNSTLSSNDGELRIWVDGNLEIEVLNANFTEGTPDPSGVLGGMTRMDMIVNQGRPFNFPNRGAIDIADMQFSRVIPPYTDINGNPWIGPLNGFLGGDDGSMNYIEIFREPYQDTNWGSRGWYDFPELPEFDLPLVSDPAFEGSTLAAEYAWAAGDQYPNGTNQAMRLSITATNTLYVSYWVKYENGYQGSQTTFHPHEFQILTTASGAYRGFNQAAQNEVAILIEQGDGPGGIGGELYPRMIYARQAVPNGQYYRASSQISTGVWHKVEAFVKLNTMTGSVGNADGIFRYWLDGVQLLNHTDVVILDGAVLQGALMNQFAIPPYIGVTSPINQTYKLDHLVLGTET